MVVYLLKGTVYFSEPVVLGSLHAKSLLNERYVSVSYGADVDRPVKESLFRMLFKAAIRKCLGLRHKYAEALWINFSKRKENLSR